MATFNESLFRFHNPESADHNWVETFLLPIVVNDPLIYVLVYFNVRPTLGVMWSQVMISDSLTRSRGELVHYNEHHFQPAPASFLSIDAPMGIKIDAANPLEDIHIRYASAEGDVDIDVHWKGLMEPFDINNPEHSPQAASQFADMHVDVGSAGYEHGGHIDMTGRITGTLRLGDREHEVDSVERMDHSWGPRDPMKVRNMFIVSATFDENLAFHMICPWRPDQTGTDAFELSHGYVMDQGKVYGLTSDATIQAEHDGVICTRLTMDVEDVRGKSYSLVATPGIGAPWVAGPNAMTHNALMRWSDGSRHDGYGVVMKNFSLRYLIANRSNGDRIALAKIVV